MRIHPIFSIPDDFVSDTEITEKLNSFLRPRLKLNKQSTRLWIVSIVLHIFVVGIVLYWGVLPTHKQSDSATLNGYLFIPLAPMMEEETKVVEALDSATIPQAIEQDDKAITTDKIQETLLPLNPVENMPNPTVNEAPILTSKNNAEVIRKSTSELIKQSLLNQHNEEASHQMAVESAKEYRQLKRSPQINTSTSVDTWKLPEVVPIKHVDCANNVKQALAILSGFTGGSVVCREYSNYQEYIDKHLNKKTK